MSKQVGGGLSKLFQLPDDHPFQPAFVQHDASQDAVSIFENKAKLSDFIGEDYPIEYIKFIEIDLLRLNTIFRQKAFNKKEAVHMFVDFADRRFKEMCDRLADNNWLKTQAKAYYPIVKVYSFLKY